MDEPAGVCRYRGGESGHTRSDWYQLRHVRGLYYCGVLGKCACYLGDHSAESHYYAVYMQSLFLAE